MAIVDVQEIWNGRAGGKTNQGRRTATRIFRVQTDDPLDDAILVRTAVGIPDISSVEDNIHAGVKYLHWLRDKHFSSDEIEPLDRILFSFAAYNAGPGNMARARKRAAQLGFDPNRWFGNVEIGMYRAVSGEPASYVRNIYKYYVTYRRLEETHERRLEAREDAD